jgi:hypothetical protein
MLVKSIHTFPYPFYILFPTYPIPENKGILLQIPLFSGILLDFFLAKQNKAQQRIGLIVYRVKINVQNKLLTVMMCFIAAAYFY